MCQKPTMHSFEQLIYDRFAQGIATWDTGRYPDIYLVSFTYGGGASRDAADKEILIQAAVCLSFNTLSHYEAQAALASSVEEAKWNNAFWLQNNSAQVPRDFPFGGDPPDDELTLRDAWCASLGIAPCGKDESGRPIYGAGFTEAICGACVRVAQALHQNGVIVAKMGRAVPIVIQDVEQCDQSGKAATRMANPRELLEQIEPLL